jgi:hypothetical protein
MRSTTFSRRSASRCSMDSPLRFASASRLTAFAESALPPRASPPRSVPHPASETFTGGSPLGEVMVIV